MSSPAAAPAANTATLGQLRQNQLAERALDATDHVVNMFSLRGFELAQRIARAVSTSNAVPAPFRQWIEKKGRGGVVEWVENTAALGNCLIAIETAQSIGVSITAVMQNANVIEGRLTWSAQYKIAAINASHRFTPLRFQIINKGIMKASYREKQGWNKEKGGFDFLDKTVEIENLECIAWALPGNLAIPPAIRTLQQAREANLPVIESAPVSMKMAVEEGWYSKSGSKWQTEMKHLMLQYRAGSFFGNIHAPDIVMGMGRTTEEAQDAIVLDVDPDGRVTSVSTEDLRTAPLKNAEVVQKNSVDSTDAPDPETGEVQATATNTADTAGTADVAAAAESTTTAAASTEGAATVAAEAQAAATFDVDAFAEKLAAAKSSDELDAVIDTLRSTSASEDEKAVLMDVYRNRAAELELAPQQTAKAMPATSRRSRSSTPSVE